MIFKEQHRRSYVAERRLASLRLRDCRWFSAQVGHRVWPSMAEFVQFLQSPNSLAFRRCSLAIRRARSLRSSVWFLRRSYSARSWRLASTSDGVGSGQRFGCRAFGAGFLVGLLGVVFRAGFPTRFFLLAGRLPALAGSGREKVNSKVWPTAHLCGHEQRPLVNIFGQHPGQASVQELRWPWLLTCWNRR